MQARHVLSNDKTDNRVVNLAWGTAKENAADRIRHGTSWPGKPVCPPGKNVRGERVNTAKLTEALVRTIRGEPGKVRDVAAKYGVSKSLVSMIRRGEVWRHVA